MRTSINIDDQLYYEAKKLAIESKTSFAKSMGSDAIDFLNDNMRLK